MSGLGLLKRREVWVPTLRGWVLLGVLAIALVTGFVVAIVPFLAPEQPEHQGILVVEGWVPDYTFEQAKRLFESHPYRLIVVTGSVVEEGLHVSKYTNYAQLGTETLRALGVKDQSVVAVANPERPRNRTFATAQRVRAWLDARQDTDRLDVLTLGVHARRTWLLYRLALGTKYRVGIIAGDDRRFDPAKWWSTSSGFRAVTSEMLALIYAKLLFYPQLADGAETASQ